MLQRYKTISNQMGIEEPMVRAAESDILRKMEVGFPSCLEVGNTRILAREVVHFVLETERHRFDGPTIKFVASIEYRNQASNEKKTLTRRFFIVGNGAEIKTLFEDPDPLNHGRSSCADRSKPQKKKPTRAGKKNGG